MVTTIPAGQAVVAKTPKAPDASSESRVDHDSHFNGLYETRQNLRIEGIAEGEIQCDGTLTVAEGARVKAKVTASTVTIAGELDGEVLCRDVFQIMPTGQVEATVSARRLIVHEGGFYNGEFHMITESAPVGAPAKEKTGSASSHPAPRPGKAAPMPSSGDGDAGNRMSSDEWWSKMAGIQPSEPDSDKPAT